MPPYRRYWLQPYRYRWRRPRRRWIQRRRPRTTFQRRFRRRRWVRRKRRFFTRRRKLKKLKLTQWQPKTIKKCHIKGYKTLFMAGPNRDNNNYAQYQDSILEQHLPGGGGWSLLIFTLDGLWEEHEKCRNWWTKSNKGLPLVRYVGCTFKFFRDYTVDYCVSYSLCYPMVDTEYTHANSSPYMMLLARNRFIVPSIKHKPKGKTYIKKRFHPPAQMKNKWYFQSDICKTGLLLLTTTAVDLNYFSCPPWSISNNITIPCLNPQIFEHKAWNMQTTQGYQPKAGNYYYCFEETEHEFKIKNLHYLGKPGPLTLGEKAGQINYTTTPSKWGNIFHPDVLNLNIPVFKSTTQMTELLKSENWEKAIQSKGTTTINSYSITRVEIPFIEYVRYNPHRDTGLNNVIYITSIETEGTGFKPPTDKNLQITGFPLWLGLWGWIDWQKKVHWVNHIDSSYILVFETKFTNPEIAFCCPIDQAFLNGHGPYDIPPEELSLYTKTTWWPKVANQLLTINNICHTGPGTQKYKELKQIQAHCAYNFTVKWGGCPAPSVDLLNPCSQPKFAVPDTLVQRLQNQNPRTPPETEVHTFDERRSQITKKCIKRIQKHTELEQTLFTITGATDCPISTKRQKIQEELQAQEEENEEATLLQQLHQQRKQQQLLKRAILQLMDPNIE
nr:MAG: ORF1 [TTV-like mini virus]